MIDIYDAELDARPTDQELYSKPKEEPICPHCKSIDVVVDSTSSWCPEVQEFGHVNSFDMWWCQNTECNRDEFKYADWRPL